MSNYPSGYDTFTTHHDNMAEPILATDINGIQDAVVAIQHGVGLNPSGTYAPLSSLLETITYNGDGTVATVTETGSGAVTTYTYNGDGTPATESRVLNGVTTTRTFAYSGGNLTGVS